MTEHLVQHLCFKAKAQGVKSLAESSQDEVASVGISGSWRAVAKFPLWTSIITALISLLLEHSMPFRMIIKTFKYLELSICKVNIGK